ncbi:hypothetical protein GCM10027046_28590 [Uliginosibacterium flavum]|uniref:Class I SAM-dependent methyltransferase n=1 Tax=Uliginosibacterium flavum TaxID=1396831 RepID=A0ABV2TGT1_9RHOO
MSRLRSHLWDASGGLVYHWRALRYRRVLWAPFVVQVADWLASWQPPQNELVIVGPSAGYTLNGDFLARFKQVTILEPDPIARSLLRRRFAGMPFVEGRVDCFSSLAGPQALADAYPQAAILFSNVLGQKLAQLDPRWPAALQTALAGHSWASYHDVIATAQAPVQAQARSFTTETSLEEVLVSFWPGGELVLHDHGSFGVLPAQAYAPWSITPAQHHLLGWKSIIVLGSSMVMPGNSGMAGRS